MKKELTQKELKKLLHYNPESGIFTWLKRSVEMFKQGKYQQRSCKTWNTRFAGTQAGTKWKPKGSNTFYIKITLNGKKRIYLAHRLAYLYTMGSFPKKDIDHIDQNGMNNAWDNLRDVTHQENHKNRSIQLNNKSDFTGVSWHKKSQKWRVEIRANRKQIHGGCFANKKDAIAKRKKMEVEYGFHANHGKLNR